ncbi:MAG: tRNA epoxyqueuosine(34) reductase QueG [Planctomycetota bacterium]
MPEETGEIPTEQVVSRLREQADRLGFPLFGVAPAVRPPGADRLDAWLASGFAGEMQYLADRRDAYEHPDRLLPAARSVVVLGAPYRTAEPVSPGPGEGRVSRYAWGDGDYHDWARDRLHQLADSLRELAPAANTRCVVDTAPILERDFARLAGLGWIGKNTLLLSKPTGSYYFLAAIITDLALPTDEPFAADHCGTCTACLDACPTDAFPQPYVLDASRCISYLTIELRGPIPNELRPGMGEWLFGCDVCQDVCPWNRKAPESDQSVFRPLEAMNPVELADLFSLDDAGFRRRFRHTPLWRAHREGLLRNAAIVLGNRPSHDALPALVAGLKDPHPLVRGASAWALGRYREAGADEALQARLKIEESADVVAEIQAALRFREAT